QMRMTCSASLARSPMPSRTHFASNSSAWAKPIQQFQELTRWSLVMIVLLDLNDKRAVRNKDNVLALYDLMINQNTSEEAGAKFVRPGYVQHSPLIGAGSDAVGKYFAQAARERRSGRVVVHRIVAVGDYVWAHVNFLNLFNDDPDDTGVVGVDIYR